MIIKVKKVKDLGIFRDYTAKADLSDFKRYNLIYGWNGCGKTTYSRLFSSLETGTNAEYPDLKYQVTCDDSTFKEGQPLTRKVRVFNQEYITDNAPSLEDPSTASKHIFILGKEDKELAAQIETDKLAKTTLEDSLNKDDKKAGLTSLNTQKTHLEKSSGQRFTDIAKVIGSSKGRAFRDYNKRDAKKVYDALIDKEELSTEEQETFLAVIEQKSMEKVNELKIPKIQVEVAGEKEVIDMAEHIHRTRTRSNLLLTQTVKQKVIEALKDHNDIAEWVADGVKLHKAHDTTTCLYCSQAIPQTRLDELAEHFNTAHQELMASIAHEVDVLQNIYATISELTSPDKNSFYDHLQKDYGKAVLDFEKQKQNLLDKVADFGTELNNKKVKSHIALSECEEIDTTAFQKSLDSIDDTVSAHNQLCENFETKTAEAKDKLERHYVSTIYDAAKKDETDLEALQKQIGEAESEIKRLSGEISTNEAIIRDSKIACDELNKNLEQFLGRKEITFEDSENGYLIKRSGKEADHLSEGEKTAIAFVYFIISLQSSDFDLKKGIVFVDDPISSFDSNSLFQAFAFLKTSLAEAHQLFIATHNFEFLRLVMNWLNHDPLSKKDKCYLMINNRFEDEERTAYLCELDNLLKDHESEYHYLFKTIYDFKSDGTIASVYNIPNIARKVLDTFLMFRVPSGETTYAKLKSLPFDEVKKTAIYKFTNDQSHITGKGFDPSLVPETQNNVKHLLELVESVFPEHYSILVASISN